MKITNTYGLPEALVQTLKWTSLPPRPALSVTELINPARIGQLTRRHWDDIEVDISEMIWMILGSSVHYILERGELPESLVEERLVAVRNGIEVRGKSDSWQNECIDDWKISSVWTLVYNPKGRKDWHSQLNLYKWLWSEQHFNTTRLRVPLILRDWQKSKAKRERDYPQMPVVTLDIPLWTPDQTLKYLDSRIASHVEARILPDDKLPLCTDEECWAKPTQYAIMKTGNKRAMRVYDDPMKAKAELPDDPVYYIEERKGEFVRCEDYCNVQPFCNQYKARQENLNN